MIKFRYFIAGFDDMQPLARLMSIVAIYTPIGHVFCGVDSYPKLIAVQFSSLIMLVVLTAKKQYWIKDK
jgi:hypothetical protein